MVRVLSRIKQFDLPPDGLLPIYKLQMLTGTYEKETVDVCKKIIRPGMTIFDIGAHVGYYTLLFSRLVEPSERADGRIAKIITARVDSSYIVPEEAVRFYLGDLSSPNDGAPDEASDLELRPYDHVFVRRIPHFEMQRTVAITGEVT